MHGGAIIDFLRTNKCKGCLDRLCLSLKTVMIDSANGSDPRFILASLESTNCHFSFLERKSKEQYIVFFFLFFFCQFVESR